MTYLSATSAMIDVFGREAAPSMNPEYDLAVRSGALSGASLRGWFGRTAIGKALVAAKARRDLNVAVKRLTELSPHLLADIGMLDTLTLAEDAPVTGVRTAPAAVALRPAQRPAIKMPQRTPARSTTKPAVRAAHSDQRAAH